MKARPRFVVTVVELWLHVLYDATFGTIEELLLCSSDQSIGI